MLYLASMRQIGSLGRSRISMRGGPGRWASQRLLAQFSDHLTGDRATAEHRFRRRLWGRVRQANRSSTRFYSHLVFRDDDPFVIGWLAQNSLLDDDGSCHFGV